MADAEVQRLRESLRMNSRTAPGTDSYHVLVSDSHLGVS
jgi:hypothetical protein